MGRPRDRPVQGGAGEAAGLVGLSEAGPGWVEFRREFLALPRRVAKSG
jgi:hypothetical protein